MQLSALTRIGSKGENMKRTETWTTQAGLEFFGWDFTL